MFQKDTSTTRRMDLHYDTENRLMWREGERTNGSKRALGRLASNIMLCVALGGILAVAKQTPAQSPQEQVLAGSEKERAFIGIREKSWSPTRPAPWIPLIYPKAKVKRRTKVKRALGGQWQLKSRPWLTWPLFCCRISTTGRCLDFQEP